MACTGACRRFPHYTTVLRLVHQDGRRFCRRCRMGYRTGDCRCRCCNVQLRTRAVCNKGKQCRVEPVRY